MISRSFKNIVTLSLSGLLLVSCAGQNLSQGVQQGSERKGGLFGLATADAVKTTTPAAFKGAQDVAIGAFTVGFLTQKTDSSKAGGGLTGSGFGGKATAHSTLTGIDDATMQKITDAAYARFLSDLKARGYNVVDRAVLTSNEAFAKTKSYPVPYEDTTGGLFSKGTITHYFAPSAFGGQMKLFPGDVAGLMGGFAFDNPSAAATEIANKGGPRVLHVVYLVDFANADKYGGWATSTSSVSVGQGLTVVPEGTRVGIIGGHAGTFSSNVGSIALGQPITSDQVFANVADVTSGANKGAQIAANVIGVIGGVGTNVSRNYEFTARPADYTAAANDAIAQATGAILGTMVSLK